MKNEEGSNWKNLSVTFYIFVVEENDKVTATMFLPRVLMLIK